MSAAGRPAARPLGELLVAQGLLSREQLALALDEQQRTGRQLGEILVARKLVSAPQIAQVLAAQRNVPPAASPLRLAAFPPEAAPVEPAPGQPQGPVGPPAPVVALAPPPQPELESLRRELAAAQDEIAALREQQESREEAAERVSLQGELAAAQDELQRLRAQRDMQLTDAQEAIADLCVQLESRQEEGVELDSRRARPQIDTGELESLRRELAAVETERDELEHKLVEAQLAAREWSAAPVVHEGAYLVFATVGPAYELIEAVGTVPRAGDIVEVHGVPHHALRLGPSPLAGSALPCVYTIPVASSPTGDSPASERRETASHGNQS